MRIEQPNRRRRLVSLTPLIDVVFILLIFFMLTSTFVDRQIFSVDAPAPSAGAPDEDDVQLLRIKVTADGYIVDEQKLAKSDLIERLRQLASREEARRVQIMPTERATVSAVTQLIDWAVGEGIEDLAVIREGRP